MRHHGHGSQEEDVTFLCKCKLKTAAQEGTHPVDRSFTSGVELLDWDAALPTLLKDCNWPAAGGHEGLLRRSETRKAEAERRAALEQPGRPVWVETTRPRASASAHRTFSVGYPAKIPADRSPQVDPKATLDWRFTSDQNTQIGDIASGLRGRTSGLTMPAFRPRAAESVWRSPQDGCSEESDFRLRS